MSDFARKQLIYAMKIKVEYAQGISKREREIIRMQHDIDRTFQSLARMGVNVTSTPIETLELNVRVCNAIVRHYGAIDCEGLAYLVFGCEDGDEQPLLSVKNFGGKSLRECREKLIENGFDELYASSQSAVSQAPLVLGTYTLSYTLPILRSDETAINL